MADHRSANLAVTTFTLSRHFTYIIDSTYLICYRRTAEGMHDRAETCMTVHIWVHGTTSAFPHKCGVKRGQKGEVSFLRITRNNRSSIDDHMYHARMIPRDLTSIYPARDDKRDRAYNFEVASISNGRFQTQTTTTDENTYTHELYNY